MLVKRLTAKEEPRRVCAAVSHPVAAPGRQIAFENHLNVFHRSNRGLSEFRPRTRRLPQFLLRRYLRPSIQRPYADQRDRLAPPSLPRPKEPRKARDVVMRDRPASQQALDRAVDLILPESTGAASRRPREEVGAGPADRRGPTCARATQLRPGADERGSALVLLALLALRPSSPWSKAGSPRLRTVELMAWLRDRYGRDYKPNTRETIRRQTLHQFVEAGLVLLNPDAPDRPVNSPNNCYQVAPRALEIAVKAYGAESSTESSRPTSRRLPGLRAQYERARTHRQIPVTCPTAATFCTDPGRSEPAAQGGGRGVLLAVHAGLPKCSTSAMPGRQDPTSKDKGLGEPWHSGA